MKTAFLIFVFLHFSGLVIRAVYERLKQNGRADPESRLTVAVIFAVMCLLWASWFNMCSLDPYKLALSAGVRWAGLGLFFAGLVFSVGATLQLRGVENIEHLVTTGLFRKTRHPMYLGFILWILGWAIYHGAALSLLCGCVTILNIIHWKRLEEKQLASRYRQTYAAYRSKTWF